MRMPEGYMRWAKAPVDRLDGKANDLILSMAEALESLRKRHVKWHIDMGFSEEDAEYRSWKVFEFQALKRFKEWR